MMPLRCGPLEDHIGWIKTEPKSRTHHSTRGEPSLSRCTAQRELVVWHARLVLHPPFAVVAGRTVLDHVVVPDGLRGLMTIRRTERLSTPSSSPPSSWTSRTNCLGEANMANCRTCRLEFVLKCSHHLLEMSNVCSALWLNDTVAQEPPWRLLLPLATLQNDFGLLPTLKLKGSSPRFAPSNAVVLW